MLQFKVQLAPPTKNVIMTVLTPKSVIELTAFIVFETARKLNSVTQKINFPKSIEQ